MFSLAVAMKKNKILAICFLAFSISVILTSCGKNSYGKQCLCPVRKVI